MLYAMFSLVLLTMIVILIGARARISSVKQDTVPLNYYALMSGAEVPVFIRKTTRHVSNLFEVPVLFYTAGVVYLSLGMTDPLPVYCAWSYVGLRLVHTFIHLGYNNVLHRLLVFALSNIALLAMWILIVTSQ
ncbi:MAG: MAPEG family protein [Gammaproteobacteria bacterium]